MWSEVLRRSDAGVWSGLGEGDLPPPDLVIMFASSDTLRRSGHAEELIRKFPNALHIGSSTGTAVQGRELTDDGSVAMALGFANTRIELATRKLADPADSETVGHALGSELAAPDLAAVFVLSDGLSVNGSALVRGLVGAVGPGVSVSGGLAGDGPRFEETLVSVAGVAMPNATVAVGLYGSALRVAHGSAGGWDTFGPKRLITRAAGNVLYELDGMPALDLYERYLGEEAAQLPASGLLYPLKIWDAAAPENEVVRTLLAIDREARSLTFAGDVPQGWEARLMRGTFYRLTEGATAAAQHARQSLAAAGCEPEACIIVSCVGRRLLMQQRTEDEIDAVANAIGRTTPVAGFYSYGEIAPDNATGFCGLHNQTMTLTLLAEVAT